MLRVPRFAGVKRLGQGRLGPDMRRVVQILVDKRMSSGDIQRAVAKTARQSMSDLIGLGVASPIYARFVDGIEGAPEEAVRLDGGRIEYVFERLAEAAAFALGYCKEMSPRRSGEFAEGWMLVVDGLPWEEAFEEISPEVTQVIVTNLAPYARRLEQAYGRTDPHYHITESAMQATARRFPGLLVRRQFVSVPGFATGLWGTVPYQRKREPRGPITYPAVVIERAAR